MPAPRGRRKAPVTVLIEDYLVANPFSANRDTAEKFKVSLPTISRIRKRLIDSGVLQPSYHDHTRPRKVVEPKIDVEGVEAVLKKIEEIRNPSGDPLTTEESLRLLSMMAREAKGEGNNKLAIDATMAFHRLQDRTTTAQLGPVPPLTHADKVSRMKILIDVVGPVILAEATISALSAKDRITFEGEWDRLKATQHTPETGATNEAVPSSPEGPNECPAPEN